jgi:lipoate-protein ligase A
MITGVKPGPLSILRDTFPGRPAYDTAVSHALLRRVARGELPESLRLYRPDDVVVFSQLDARRPGFERAVRAAHAAGFGAVVRLAGGHAAVFHAECLAFGWALPEAGLRCGIRARFELMATRTADALRSLGVDARVGEVAGEYCPGEHSVNAAGERKLMGVGQRVVRGAAHVGGVIVVGGGERVRDVLIPVYEALELDWRPETVGCVRDEVSEIDCERVSRALLTEFARSHELVSGQMDSATFALAGELETRHRPLPSAASPAASG